MELDQSRVRQFGDPDTEGGRRVLRDLFSTYLADTRVAVARLRAAREIGDVALLRSLAHGEKGAAAVIGADRLAARFESIEHAPADRDAVARTLDAIPALLDRLAHEIDDLLGGPAPS